MPLKPPEIDPLAVRRQFARRAATFDGADFLYREIEQRMFERLDFIRIEPALIVDAGCGLGRGAEELVRRFPQARLLAIDSALAMLRANRMAGGGDGVAQRMRRLARRWLADPATRQQPKGPPAPGAERVDLLAADAHRLPVATERADLLWSNALWHWLLDPPAAAAEWHRILRTDGLLMFSAFGVDTLREVRGLGAQLPEFPDLHDIGDLLGQSGFADPVVDTERLTLNYPDGAALLSDWHGMAGNAAPTRRPGLATPAQRRQWLAAIEGLRGADGRITVSVEIVFAHAWRGQPKVAAGEYQPITWTTRRPRD